MKTQKIWNLIGKIFYLGVNRIKLGDNRSIHNWITIGDRQSYRQANIQALDGLRTLYAHTFWHGELNIRQMLSIKSFLCTQPKELFKLWIWLDGEEYYEKALKNEDLVELIHSQKGRVQLKKWDLQKEIAGTPFEKISWYFRWERPLTAVADDFRIIALYKYGGLYFDLDVMFLKDFSALIMRDEFVYAWENQPFANNAIIFLRKDSYLCQQIVRQMIRRKSSQPWIVFRYKLKDLSPLMVYPCAFFDPLWTGYETGMPLKTFDDFFRQFSDEFPQTVNSYRDFFPGAYAYHWHNRWNHPVFKDSYFGIFYKEFAEELQKKVNC